MKTKENIDVIKEIIKTNDKSAYKLFIDLLNQDALSCIARRAMGEHEPVDIQTVENKWENMKIDDTDTHHCLYTNLWDYLKHSPIKANFKAITIK